MSIDKKTALDALRAHWYAQLPTLAVLIEAQAAGDGDREAAASWDDSVEEALALIETCAEQLGAEKLANSMLDLLFNLVRPPKK